jgi:thioredoxin reductase (NADPH)
MVRGNPRIPAIVRSGSVKRVAAAVGEGAQVVATLHAYLTTAERNSAVSRAE